MSWKTLPQPLGFVRWRHNTPFSNSAEENFLERFLIFFHMGCFHCTISKKAQLWLCLALPFLKYAIHHLLHVFCSQNGQFSLFFWWKYLPGSDEEGWNFQHWTLQCCRAGTWALRGSKLWPAHGENPNTGCSLKRRGHVFLEGTKRRVWYLPMWSQSWNGLGANNELLRTFKLKKNKMQAVFLQPGLFQEVQFSSSDYMLKSTGYGI